MTHASPAKPALAVPRGRPTKKEAAGFRQRPKSREETPKEGCADMQGTSKRRRTMTLHCTKGKEG